MVSQTASACASSALSDLRRSREMMPPWNSKERCVLAWFWGIVPMSCSRQVSRYVSGRKCQDGKCCFVIA